MKLKLAPVDSNLWGKKGKSMRLTLTPADSHVHIVLGKKGKSMRLRLTPADSLVNCILYRVRKGQLTGYEHRKLKNILIFLSHLSFLITVLHFCPHDNNKANATPPFLSPSGLQALRILKE